MGWCSDASQIHFSKKCSKTETVVFEMCTFEILHRSVSIGHHRIRPTRAREGIYRGGTIVPTIYSPDPDPARPRIPFYPPSNGVRLAPCFVTILDPKMDQNESKMGQKWVKMAISGVSGFITKLHTQLRFWTFLLKYNKSDPSG